MTSVKLAPKILGLWTRRIRQTSHWSQEALAEASGLHTRTIQRIEAGYPISITTRRALARGLGYENQDVFDDPAFIKQLTETLENTQSLTQQEMLEQQLPDQMRIKVECVVNGEALGHFIGNSKVTAFHTDTEMSQKAKRATASLFDYISDMMDLYNKISFSERLVIHSELDKALKELGSLGVRAYSAMRTTKILSEDWENKTPMPLTIGYLTVVPAKKDIQEMTVPRRISWG